MNYLSFLCALSVILTKTRKQFSERDTNVIIVNKYLI